MITHFEKIVRKTIIIFFTNFFNLYILSILKLISDIGIGIENMSKKLVATALATTCLSAMASVVPTEVEAGCTSYGNRLVCDNVTYSTYGNRSIGSDGYSSTTYGNRTIGNDGYSFTSYGNRTIGSDGFSTTQYGNRTIGSDGSSMTQYGNRYLFSN